MNRQDPDVVAIVGKLKERARAHPWVPMGVPPQQHFHRFPNGLSLCFTLDVLPGMRLWHLSIARVPGEPTEEEIEFWRRAFFDEEPAIELPSQIPRFNIKALSLEGMMVNLSVKSDQLNREDLRALLQAIRDCEMATFPQKHIYVTVEAPDMTSEDMTELLTSIKPPYDYGPVIFKFRDKEKP